MEPRYGGVFTVNSDGVIEITTISSDTIGWGRIRGCKHVPLAWKKLYLGIVYCKTKVGEQKSQHHEKMSICLVLQLL